MTFSCPVCTYQNAKGSLKCSQCLLVFAKYEQKEVQKEMGLKQAVVGSSYLREMWDHVIADYGNKDFHEKFIQTALAEKNLPYASQQYRRMIEANPADDIALKMRDRIIQLVTLTYVPPSRPALEQSKRWGLKIFVFVVLVILLSLVLQVAFK